ncbi:MAG: hypothetical protein E6R04_06880 [Spirochaetes bacterium]|nr:MAG: hypothetical protein E6R04_06880 [Spirochaetota bacterium]
MLTLALPSRIGVLGDVHGDMASLVRGGFQVARKHGITHIVQVGDFWLYDPRDLAKIDRQAALHGVEALWFYDGNHENFTTLGDRVDRPGGHRMSEVLTYLGRGTRFSVGRRSAVALGGAASTDRLHNAKNRIEGKGWWAREVITPYDARAAADGGKADILFSHDVSSSGMYAHGLSYRSTDTITEVAERTSRRNLSLVEMEVEPELVVHGHFHLAKISERYASLGRNTKPGFFGILDSETLTVDLLLEGNSSDG